MKVKDSKNATYLHSVHNKLPRYSSFKNFWWYSIILYEYARQYLIQFCHCLLQWLLLVMREVSGETAIQCTE